MSIIDRQVRPTLDSPDKFRDEGDRWSRRAKRSTTADLTPTMGEDYGGRTTNRERAGNLSRTSGDKRNSLMKPINRIHDVEASATTEVITKAM